jgi:hypothetical protein
MNTFIDHLQVVTTNIHNTIAISTLYSSLDYSIQSSVLSLLLDISWQRLEQWLFLCLRLSSSLHRLPYRTDWPNWLCSLLITFRHGPHKKPQLFHCCSPAVALLRICCLATGTCLQSRCPETALVHPPISRSFHSNGYTSYNTIFSLEVDLNTNSGALTKWVECAEYVLHVFRRERQKKPLVSCTT